MGVQRFFQPVHDSCSPNRVIRWPCVGHIPFAEANGQEWGSRGPPFENLMCTNLCKPHHAIILMKAGEGIKPGLERNRK